MNKRKKSLRLKKSRQASTRSIGVSLGTMVIAGLFLFLSSAYDPSWVYDWGDIRAEIKDSTILIEKYNSITSGVIGINAYKPQQWSRRRWLKKHATIEELKHLIEHPNSVVKTTAYEALVKRDKAKAYNYIIQALNDTTSSFIFYSGCVGSRMTPGSFLLERVIPISDNQHPPNSKYLESYNLTEEKVSVLKKTYQKHKVQNTF